MVENLRTDVGHAEYIITDTITETMPRMTDKEMAKNTDDDLKYLLDQCDTLVRERDALKQRAFDAERMIAKLKMDRQQMIQTISNSLNQS